MARQILVKVPCVASSAGLTSECTFVEWKNTKVIKFVQGANLDDFAGSLMGCPFNVSTKRSTESTFGEGKLPKKQV